MEDKDRFGDKLRDKEKAEENRFIAEQEQAKLQKLREQLSKSGAPRGLCPRDGTPLISRQQDGVTLEDCPMCKGLWMDQGELDRLLARRKEEPWMSHWIRTFLEQQKV